MKTFRDILRHHIKDNDLLNLIDYYCKTYPNGSEILDDVVDGDCSERLYYILKRFIDFDKTDEGQDFWFILLNYVYYANIKVYEWKPIMSFIMRLPSEYMYLIEPYLKTSEIDLKKFNAVDLGFIIALIYKFNIIDHNTEESRIFRFMRKNSRPPNDFDDLEDYNV